VFFGNGVGAGVLLGSPARLCRMVPQGPSGDGSARGRPFAGSSRQIDPVGFGLSEWSGEEADR